MKKLSFSVFALLGVVLAVASAFTTTEKKLAPAAITYEVRSLPNNTYTAAVPPTTAQAQSGGLFGTYVVSQNLLSATFTSHCLSDDTYLCFAQVKVDNGTPSIVSTSFGDFN